MNDSLSHNINQMFPVEKDDIGLARREGPYVVGYYVNWFVPIDSNHRLGYMVRNDTAFVRCSVRTPTGELIEYELVGTLSTEHDIQIPLAQGIPFPHHNYNMWMDGIRKLQEKIRTAYPQF